MNAAVSVVVGVDGRVTARDQSTQQSITRDGRWDGLDADLVRLFERWLADRDRLWRDDELTALGRLLHRRLFSDAAIWSFVRSVIDAQGSQGLTRVRLGFPASGPYARLSALPWEYLYRPDTSTAAGYLAGGRRVVLSRFITNQAADVEPKSELTVLVVVSQPDDPRLGPVVHEPTLRAIEETAQQIPLRVLEPLTDRPTAEDLIERLTYLDEPPDLIHFMGHGEFDPEKGTASMALCDQDGRTDLVDDRVFADILTRGGPPSAVVLHSCDAGRADFELGFAGVAPQLVLQGVPFVVAMQYPVKNSMATDFSIALYEQLASGKPVDHAVQEARWRINAGTVPRDPRLIGVPVVYAQSDAPLLDLEEEEG